jgi:outer membrane protein TolC
VERAERESPELIAAQSEIESGELGVKLAGRAARPEFSVQAGYMNRGGLDPMWQAGLSVEWPLLSKGRARAAISEAEGERQRARHQAEAVGQELRLRVEERRLRLAATARVAALYEQGILPQGRLALEAALAQYRAGRAPLASVLEASLTLAADRAFHLAQIVRYETIQARLLAWRLDPDEDDRGSMTMAAREAPMGLSAGAGAPSAMSGMGEGR